MTNSPTISQGQDSPLAVSTAMLLKIPNRMSSITMSSYEIKWEHIMSVRQQTSGLYNERGHFHTTLNHFLTKSSKFAPIELSDCFFLLLLSAAWIFNQVEKWNVNQTKVEKIKPVEKCRNLFTLFKILLWPPILKPEL